MARWSFSGKLVPFSLKVEIYIPLYNSLVVGQNLERDILHAYDLGNYCLGGHIMVLRPVIPDVLSAALENVWIFLYREARDCYWGLLKNPSWFLMRKFGRFCSIRALVKSHRQRLTRGSSHDLDSGQHQSLFEGIHIDQVVQQMRRDGLYVGIHLPQAAVQELVALAMMTPCYANGRPIWGFHYHEKEATAQQLGIDLTTADYFNTSAHAPIQRIIDDPVLRRIAATYLEGEPVHQGTNLRWSFGASLSDYEKYKYSRMYHYDLDDYQAIKFFFYLTDVDANAGPHVCVLGSHKVKKILHQWLRGKCSDQTIVDYYGIENIKVIRGEAGCGFVEDTFCMHKGDSPLHGDRLILIIEYALRDYGMQHDRIEASRLQSVFLCGQHIEEDARTSDVVVS